MQLTGTGLCLELKRAVVLLSDKPYRFLFGTEYGRLWRAVNRYLFVFGNE